MNKHNKAVVYQEQSSRSKTEDDEKQKKKDAYIEILIIATRKGKTKENTMQLC